jgi:hypothetical protein
MGPGEVLVSTSIQLAVTTTRWHLVAPKKIPHSVIGSDMLHMSVDSLERSLEMHYGAESQFAALNMLTGNTSLPFSRIDHLFMQASKTFKSLSKLACATRRYYNSQYGARKFPGI